MPAKTGWDDEKALRTCPQGFSIPRLQRLTQKTRPGAPIVGGVRVPVEQPPCVLGHAGLNGLAAVVRAEAADYRGQVVNGVAERVPGGVHHGAGRWRRGH